MAKYDGAQTTANDRKHWVNADQLSADAAANPSVRQILRNRARYEVANGCYAQGIVLTLANDVIGTGPHLQMLTDMETANAVIETEFAAWSSKIRLAEKLRTMRIAKAQDGEAFALLFSNDNLDSPVKLDVRLIEADQIATPMPPLASATDGIEFDTFGNPSAYHVMKSHPGDMIGGVSFAYDRVPASSMLHWFRADRPGQSRGVSEMTPAINMFGQLRQYRQATLDAARAAANLSLAIKTTMPSGGEARDVDSMTEMEMVPNMAVFLPEGWEPYQIKAEQPTT
ncbi:MAG: phage portal protein, partial [Planctomycetes bacterium]|nr:phage portal protein [Planctomycetota bacterium]